MFCLLADMITGYDADWAPPLDPPHPQPGDRRSVLLEVTLTGRATADQMLPGIRTLEKSILSALTH